jgi:hypothetical protein
MPPSWLRLRHDDQMLGVRRVQVLPKQRIAKRQNPGSFLGERRIENKAMRLLRRCVQRERQAGVLFSAMRGKSATKTATGLYEEKTG